MCFRHLCSPVMTADHCKAYTTYTIYDPDMLLVHIVNLLASKPCLSSNCRQYLKLKCQARGKLNYTAESFAQGCSDMEHSLMFEPVLSLDRRTRKVGANKESFFLEELLPFLSPSAWIDAKTEFTHIKNPLVYTIIGSTTWKEKLNFGIDSQCYCFWRRDEQALQLCFLRNACCS